MQLRRIEIRDFRKLGHTVIDGIGDGLCVIVGDNEAGKSTILSALRAVLFERHRGTGEHVRRMLPYGQTVRPEISIEFDLAGRRWRLRKAFNQRPEAELEGGGERLVGDAVEDRLAQLLRFTPAGRGESKRDENQGLYGLLWVEQGQSHRALGVGEGGKSTLASAIEGEIGQIVGGERGRVLLAAAAQRHDLFWGRNDKPRGEYRALGEELEQLREHATSIGQTMQRFDGKVQALATRADALARHRREDRLARAVDAVSQHRRSVEGALAVETARDLALRALDAAAQDRTIATERRQRRSDMIDRLDTAWRDEERALSLATEARSVCARQQAVAEAAAREADAARQIRITADRRLQNIDQAMARRRRQDAFEGLAVQLAEAEAQAARRRDILASVAGVAVSAKDVADLERLQSTVDRAGSALAAASVRIEFEPDGTRGVALDGSPIASGMPLGLCKDAVLWLEGFGQLRIRPGGGVEDLARAQDDAAQALDARLRGLGLSSVADAKAKVMRRRDIDAEVTGLDRLLTVLAPRGLDPMRQAVENERAGLARPLSDEVRTSLDADDGALERARQARDAAAASEDSAKAAAEIGRAAREAAAREHAIADDRASRARAQREAVSAELGAARAAATDDALRDRQAAVEATLAAASAALARAEVGLDGSDAAVARLDLERAEGAERSIRADLARLTAEARELEVELGALGQGGLGEELSQITGQIERLERDKAAQDLEAKASRLLLETLSEAQRDSKERWLGPVRQRVKPYLKFLEPDSDIVLDERTLEIEGIVRNGVSEPFSSLSVGAREQMAVITRLALADILRGAGASSALILDDALVNTDEGRLERMHRVLQTAAKSLQVLVLTCRERDFVGLGEIKRL